MKDLLDSRYGRNYLVLDTIENNNSLVTYKLITESKYIRIGGSYPDNIEFVDPPGGPFMKVGAFQHKDMILSKISHIKDNFYLTFKNDTDNIENS